jgi:hypothetical protein
LGEVGPKFGDEVSNFGASLVSDAPKAGEIAGVLAGQFLGVYDAEAVEDVLDAGADTELGDGGGGANFGECGMQRSRIGGTALYREVNEKGAVPGSPHIDGVVETLAGVAAEGFAKESGEGFADGRVYEFGLNGDVVVNEMGRAEAVTPTRDCAGGHFVKDDSGGITFGGSIPAAAAGELEEWFEVGRGAGADVVERGIGQGEIEEFESILGVLAEGLDADVLGLEVAVADAFGFEVLDNFEEVFTVAVEEFEGEASDIFELLS